MPEFLLLLVIALVVAALVFGVGALLTGSDPGLTPVEPEGESRGLPSHRPLVESDFASARFDTTFRGYRMSQVDVAMARAAYDIGFKQEMIETLRAEITALREGRTEDAEMLRKARESASGSIPSREPTVVAEFQTEQSAPAGSAATVEPETPSMAEPETPPALAEESAPAESVKRPE